MYWPQGGSLAWERSILYITPSNEMMTMTTTMAAYLYGNRVKGLYVHVIHL